jgi:Na+/H+ antiporter NhaA
VTRKTVMLVSAAYIIFGLMVGNIVFQFLEGITWMLACVLFAMMIPLERRKQQLREQCRDLSPVYRDWVN